MLLEVGAGHPAVRVLAERGVVLPERLLPAVGREALHRFTRLFAILDEL